ncbi:tRNA pseudouridine(55) synthase TruB [Sphingomonas sp. DG1-23]|uniref:tRNA pseudouridine(55) synthase TruB n=1 Tax=Sphingomonas sp. DG1-23 TaxID=3068316 RepID=UPI00273EA4E4|nr:tRNA pseudouridine(55) synthase TruB [Sphingomonas sp. DG1-23]MDP5280865.1 tRNA pseudouridine(55) synthase TruB [Sphingomonas sp. DG1-23]
MHGWIILDKPLGLGSTQGVSAVKRALRDGGYGKFKVGHGGTLDPLATGVLPIAIGEATKLAGRMLDSDKVYAFTIRFGTQTDTLDLEGKVIATSEVRPTIERVEAVLPRFTGPIAQVPPAYSALKIGGERAYDLARAGEEVVLPSRDVTIHSLTLSSPAKGRWQPQPDGGGGSTQVRDVIPPPPPPSTVPLPLAGEERIEEITLTAHVSKGTYIRSLARDIALALGTVGHVTMLRRVKAGPFSLDPAISLDKLADAAKARSLEHYLLPLRAGLDDIPALALAPDQAGLLRRGQVLAGIAVEDGQYFAMLDAVPVALVEAQAGFVRVVRGFNL